MLNAIHMHAVAFGGFCLNIHKAIPQFSKLTLHNQMYNECHWHAIFILVVIDSVGKSANSDALLMCCHVGLTESPKEKNTRIALDP